MILDLFLPSKIGNYYLFTHRVAGIEINKTQIRATIVVAKESKVVIEQCIEVPIENNREIPQDQRIINALTIVKNQLPRCHICSVLSSSVVIYKELLLPFISRETIAQVIKFEVEPLLPFKVDQAIVDFIITKTVPEENNSQIMVAAIQKQYIAQHLALFEQAGMQLNTITTDLFALYNLYLYTPEYTQNAGNIVIMDMSLHVTRIAFIQHNQLRFVRTINNGLSACAKYVGDQLHIPTIHALEQLLRFGVEKEHHEPEAYQAIVQGCTQLWQTVQFTLTSLNKYLGAQETIDAAYILGEGAQIPGLISFIGSYLGIPATAFDIQQITTNPTVSIGKQIHTLNSSYSISLGAALPSPLLEDFNLRAEEFEVNRSSFYLHQLIAVGLLLAVIFGTLLTFNIMRLHSITTERDNAQEEAITALHERFTSVSEDETDLDEAIKTATEELNREEQTWFAFSNKTRFLQYLLELTNRIDKKELGFKIDALTITPQTITMTAQVKSRDALVKLERELKQSPLFRYNETQDQTSFTMKINIAQKQGEQ